MRQPYKSSDTRLLVTVDVERDSDSRWSTLSELRFQSVLESFPRLFFPLCRRFSVRPTLFLSPEILLSRRCTDYLRSLSRGELELASHLHGEYLVPKIKSWTFSGPRFSVRDMQWQYSEAIEYEKLATLTELFFQQFDFAPKAFRAGRFGAGHSTAKHLARLGYQVDSSVTPHIRWRHRFRNSPDYTKASELPYTISPSGDLWEPGESSFLEVPITIMKPEALKISGVEPVWFRPWYSTKETMVEIIDAVLSQNKSEGTGRPLVMMFHSVELVPGASPYPQTPSEVDQYMLTLETVFEYCEKLGIVSSTLSEFYESSVAKDVQKVV